MKPFLYLIDFLELTINWVERWKLWGWKSMQLNEKWISTVLVHIIITSSLKQTSLNYKMWILDLKREEFACLFWQTEVFRQTEVLEKQMLWKIFCLRILYSDICKNFTKFAINITPIRIIILYSKTPSLFKSQVGNRLLLIFSGCFGMNDLQHPGKDLRPKKA